MVRAFVLRAVILVVGVVDSRAAFTFRVIIASGIVTTTTY